MINGNNLKLNRVLNRRIMVILAFLFVFVSVVNISHASVPGLISYKSRLRNADGTPVTTATTIQFSLYNDLSLGNATNTPSSVGPLLWTETYNSSISTSTCQQITPDANGYFSVNLGSCVTFPSYLDFNSPNIYLGVKIATDAEATPRVQFTSAPFALNSQRINGLFASSTALANQLLALDANLNLNIASGTFIGTSLNTTNATITNLSVPNSLSSLINVLTSNIGGSISTTTIINSNTINYSGGIVTSNVNGVISTTSIVGLLPTTTNTLASSANTLTSTVNGVASSSLIINSNVASSSGNLFQTIINGIVSNVANIINSFTQTLSGNTLTTTINGVVATSSVISSNTLSTSGTTLTSNVNGVATSTDLTNLVASSTTNSLTSSVNTLTSIVNGHTSTSSIINTNTLSTTTNTFQTIINGISSGITNLINSFSQSLSGNTLTTTINGVVATSSVISSNGISSTANVITSNVNGVSSSTNIINTNTLSTTTNTFQTIINGISSGITNLINSFTQSLSGNTLTTTINGVTATSSVISSNSLSTNGTVLTSNVNGVSTSTDLANIVSSSTNNTLSSSANTLTSNVNGKVSTSTIINTTVASSSGNLFQTIINGISSGVANLINSFTQSVTGNVLSTNVNGVIATTTVITNNTINYSGGIVTSNVNGVISTTSIVGLLPTTTNTLSLSGNILTSLVNGISATSTTVSSNNIFSSGNLLTSNVNGVSSSTNIINTASASSSANLFNVIINGISSSVANIINSFTQTLSGNTLTTTINGIVATSSVISSNTLSTSGSTLTSNVNGVSTNSDLTNLVASSTSNSLTSSVNTLTSIVNGKSANASIINTTVASSSGNLLQTVINGVSSAVTNIINSNVLSVATSTNSTTLTSNINGISSNTTFNTINSNTLTYSNNTLTTIVNGVSSAVTNIINSFNQTLSGNTLTTTINGVSATSSVISSNTLSYATSTNVLSSTINGVLATTTVGLSGSYLPLAGGTLTGGLVGTTATFTGITNSSLTTAGLVTNTASGVEGTTNGTGFIKMSGGTVSYDNSTYLTTSSAASTYQPLENQRLSTTNSPTFGGLTLTGALTGTSASFSSGITITGGAGSAGSVTYNGAYGLLMQGKTAATGDSAIFTPAGSVVWYNPTGTTNSTFGGNVTATSFIGAGSSLTSLPTNTALYPTLNQNTTGTASNVTGVVAVANGGTGATTLGTSLTNSASTLNTIQDIRTSASPQFVSPVFTGGLLVGNTSYGAFGTSNIGISANGQIALSVGDPVTTTNAGYIYFRSTGTNTVKLYTAGAPISLGTSVGASNLTVNSDGSTTLGGALSGTTATFTSTSNSTITSTFQNTDVTNASSRQYVNITAGNRTLSLRALNTDNSFVQSNGGNIQIQPNNATAVTFNSDQTTTFASTVTASSFIKSGGTSSQFLKADGSVDSNAYLTSASLAGYLPLTGGTMTGALTFAANVWNTSGGSNRFYFDSANTYFGSPSFWVFQNSVGTNVVSITSAGNATFAGTITANTMSDKGSSGNILVQGASGLIQYRTPSEILTDIGGLSTGSNTTISSQTYLASTTIKFGSAGYVGLSSSIFTGGSATDLGVQSISGNIWFGTNLTPTMFLLANGNLGINTASPGYKLDVAGDINSSGVYRLSTTQVAALSGSTITLGSTGTNSLSLYAGAADRLFINYSTGNVGIGTASPSQKLNVNGNVQIDNGQIAVNQGYSYQFGPSGYYMIAPTATRLGIYTAGSEALSILNSGNVGIGTTAPAVRLHVVGATDTASAYFDAPQSTVSNSFNVIYRTSNNAGVGGANLGQTSLWQAESSTEGVYNNLARLFVNQTNAASTTATGDMQFQLYQNGSLITPLTLQGSTGNVGIGTTAPGSKLDVAGQINIANSGGDSLHIGNNQFIKMANISGTQKLLLGISSNDETYLRGATVLHLQANDGGQEVTILNNGNVGIGTTGPTLSLDTQSTSTVIFSGTGYRVARFHSTSGVNADQPGIILGYDSAGAGIIAADTQVSGQPIAFWTYSGTAWGERARIDKGGNMGIGTTNTPGLLTLGSGNLYWATDGGGSIGSNAGNRPLNISMAGGLGVNANAGAAGTITAASDITVTGTSNGLIVTNPSMTMYAARPSYFGYSTGYGVVLIGNTSGNKNLAFNVDVSGNPSGAFSGTGNDYVWRNAGNFITPNAANTAYNTLFTWNSSGQLTVNNAATFSGQLNANANIYISSAAPTLLFTNQLQTTTYGYIQYSGGTMNFNTGATGATFSGSISGTSATFSGGIDLGVTPLTWASIYANGIRSASGAAMFGYNGSPSINHLSANYFVNGASADVFIGTGYATDLYQNAGTWSFRTSSASGLANGAITWTTPLSIATTGAATFSNYIYLSGGTGSGRIVPSTDNAGYVGESTHRFSGIYSYALDVAGTGLFTSSVTAQKFITSSTAAYVADFNSSNVNGSYITLSRGTPELYIGYYGAIGGTGLTPGYTFDAAITGQGFNFLTGGNGAPALTIAANAAATFSSSVTATEYLGTPLGASAVYNIVNSNSTFTGSYNLQAGGGSVGYGGSLVMYGHSHATKPGWVVAGISAGSGGKFSVQNGANGAGTDVFTVDTGGNGVFNGSASAGSYQLGGVNALTFSGTTVSLANNSYWQSINLVTNGTTALSIASTGAATFASDVTMVHAIVASGGNATNPIIYVNGNTNTGIFFPTNTISFTTAGTQALTINSSQAATFAADATINGLTIGRGAGNISTNVALGSGALAGNTTGSNNLAIGTNAMNAGNPTGTGNTVIGNSAWTTNSSNVGSNNVVIGYNIQTNTSPIINNNIIIGNNINLGAGSSNIVQMGNSSIATANIQVAWTITSDQKFKTNVATSSLGLDFLDQLRPVSYNRYQSDGVTPQPKNEYGFIAQEVKSLLDTRGITNDTGLLSYDTYSNTYSLRYNDFIPILTKGLQELENKTLDLNSTSSALLFANVGSSTLLNNTIQNSLNNLSLFIASSSASLGEAACNQAGGVCATTLANLNDLFSTSSLASIKALTNSLTQNNFSLNLNGNALVNVKAIESASGNWKIGDDGIIYAKEVHADKYCNTNGSRCIDISNMPGATVTTVTTGTSAGSTSSVTAAASASATASQAATGGSTSSPTGTSTVASTPTTSTSTITNTASSTTSTLSTTSTSTSTASTPSTTTTSTGSTSSPSGSVTSSLTNTTTTTSSTPTTTTSAPTTTTTSTAPAPTTTTTSTAPAAASATAPASQASSPTPTV